jgi:hypothetical protein
MDTSGSDESSGSDDQADFDESEGSLPKLDLPPQPDVPPLPNCTVTWTDPVVLMEYPDCPIDPFDGFCESTYLGCVTPAPGQTCAELCPDGDCVDDWTNCTGEASLWYEPTLICGPYEIDGMCCSIGEYADPECGRPFIIAGVARTAALRVDAPQYIAADGEPLPAAIRARLVAHWTRVAVAEHASVASFARFAQQLLALAAPAALVRDALQAAVDEARHAEVALALAVRHVGQTLAFDSLDVRGSAQRCSDPELAGEVGLERVLLACVREGCIGETLAALELTRAAERCSDPELAGTLAAIAADETRHATLAWRFVAWALNQHPHLRAKVLELVAATRVGAAAPELLSPAQRRMLRAHGCLPNDERLATEREGLRELVRPCIEALCGQPSRDQAHSGGRSG